MTLTPMIIATFPILIGLGVDYALHMLTVLKKCGVNELMLLLKKTKVEEKANNLSKSRLVGSDFTGLA